MQTMQAFRDELTVTMDCKVFEKPSLSSPPLTVLAEGQLVYCRDAGEAEKRPRKPALSPKNNSGKAGAVFAIQER